MSKLKTAIWFLKNPAYFSQIFQVLKRRKNEALENTSTEATAWCKQHSLPMQEALKVLEIEGYSDIDTIFPELFDEARAAADAAPVKMGGEGALSLIYHLVKKAAPQKLLETGVAYGWSSLAILLALQDHKVSKLISNDMPYINMGNDDYVGCVVPAFLRDKWTLQRLPDFKGIPLALKTFGDEIDFCHYDSDKSYTGRSWASPLLWEALKSGSYFVSDDINDNLAFKHFSKSVNREPVVIEHLGKYVGVIVK